jgi:hypothetical protein
VRRKLVLGTVARQERDPGPFDVAQQHGTGRVSVRGLDGDLLDFVKERVEARPPEDPDVGARAH